MFCKIIAHGKQAIAKRAIWRTGDSFSTKWLNVMKAIIKIKRAGFIKENTWAVRFIKFSIVVYKLMKRAVRCSENGYDRSTNIYDEASERKPNLSDIWYLSVRDHCCVERGTYEAEGAPSICGLKRRKAKKQKC